MHALSKLGLTRLRQAVSFHAQALIKQNDPTTRKVEDDLSTLGNVLRDAEKELKERGRITIEVKK